MTAARRRKLAALSKLRKRAAYAPHGTKLERLKKLKAIINDMLKNELRNVP